MVYIVIENKLYKLTNLEYSNLNKHLDDAFEKDMHGGGNKNWFDILSKFEMMNEPVLYIENGYRY